MSAMRLVWNLAAFQVGWFACVLGGAQRWPWLGTAVVAGLIGIHLLLAARPVDELKLVAAAAFLGFAWDSVLVASGLLVYPSGVLLAGTAPHWIVAMWANFATLPNVSLRWLKGRPVLASVLGGLGGPLAFYAGSALGGVQFTSAALALLALGLGWALLMPALMALSQRYDGVEPRSMAAGYA
jgi:hypothetical protein